jgi:hypothetical protein
MRDLESILRARMLKILLQHNLPEADSCTAAKQHCYSITLDLGMKSIAGATARERQAGYVQT